MNDITAEVFGNNIVVFKKCLPTLLCEQLISAADKNGLDLHLTNSTTTPGYREGTQYSESTINASSLVAYLSERLQLLIPNYFSLCGIPIPSASLKLTNPTIKQYKHSRSDNFGLHFDTTFDTTQRTIAIIWYLNDVNNDGRTIFPYFDIGIEPKIGDCLMFPTFWTHAHYAEKPLDQDKYTLNVFGNT